jgi:hypothetical protein
MALNQGYTSTTKLGNDKSYTVIDPGPYVAIVKENRDVTRMGRIGVVIPAIHNAQNVNSDQLITCDYLAPFYGAKSPNAVNTTDITSYEQSQHSYGMWMVPPDIDTKVLVTFAEGKINQAYWMGCIQEPFVNHMTPGIASSTNTYNPLGVGGGENDPTNKVSEKIKSFGTEDLPAGEVNRGIWDSASAAGFDKLKKPIHPFANTLKKQGLVKDNVRGTTSSSARRETPSNVFGISTPGRIDTRSNKKAKVGTLDDQQEKVLTRNAGHTFVMDDGDVNGANQLVRLRTSSGHQLVMSDSAGVVYLANADGTVWMEFSNNGLVDVYAQTGYNLRSGADINFHAEGNINMYANKSIKLKANEENGIVAIDGANILNYASNNITNFGTNVYQKATTNIVSDAGQRNIQQGMTRVDLIGGQVHFNSYPTISNLVTPLQRTSYTAPTGTGTLLTDYPDVTLKPLGENYEVDRALPGMSGMRIPTHEPFWGHQDNAPAFGSVGGTNTNIGTAGHIEDLNRNSDLLSVRWAQYKADLDAELSKQPTKSADSVIELFNANKRVSQGTNFLTANIDDYQTLDAVESETYNKIIATPNTVAGTSYFTTVSVNESGVLYTKGTTNLAESGTVKKTGNLSQVRTISSGANVYNNMSNLTTTYKNVVGGKVTSVVQTAETVSTVANVVTTVSKVARSVGKYFGF